MEFADRRPQAQGEPGPWLTLCFPWEVGPDGGSVLQWTPFSTPAVITLELMQSPRKKKKPKRFQSNTATLF